MAFQARCIFGYLFGGWRLCNSCNVNDLGTSPPLIQKQSVQFCLFRLCGRLDVARRFPENDT